MEDSDPQPEAGSPGDEATEPAPAEGEYRAPWWTLPTAVIAAIVVSGVGVSVALLHPGVPSQWRWPIIACTGVVGLLLLADGLSRMKAARWDDTGVEFQWWWGGSKSYAWEDLRGIRFHRSSGAMGDRDATYVLTTSGEEIPIEESGRNYQQFAATLRTRLGERRRYAEGDESMGVTVDDGITSVSHLRPGAASLRYEIEGPMTAAALVALIVVTALLALFVQGMIPYLRPPIPASSLLHFAPRLAAEVLIWGVAFIVLGGFLLKYPRRVDVDSGGLTLTRFWGASRQVSWNHVAAITQVPYRGWLRPLWGGHMRIELADGTVWRTTASKWFLNSLEECMKALGRDDLLHLEPPEKDEGAPSDG